MVGGRSPHPPGGTAQSPPNAVAANGAIGDAAFIALDLGLQVLAQGIANLDAGGTRLAQDAEIRLAEHNLALPTLDSRSTQCQWPEGAEWAFPAFIAGEPSQPTQAIIVAAHGSLTVIQPSSERIELPPLCTNVAEVPRAEQAAVALVVSENSAAVALTRSAQSRQRAANLPSAPWGAEG